MNSSKKFELIHKTISSGSCRITIKEMCKIAGVSRSGYYNYINSIEKKNIRELQDQSDFNLILEAYNYRGYKKGVRSIYMRLLHYGVVMNQKKIRRLMHKYGLQCPIRKANPYRQMAKAIKTSNYANNILERNFEEFGPRMVLLTDITYIPYNGTFAYLSTILDAYTKEVLSYVLSPSLELDFVLQTINLLIDKHAKELKSDTLIHSDQGCHYTSYKFIELTENSGLRRSMSRRGNCWDNAPQESFFGHMKDEIGDKIRFTKHYEEIKLIIDDWIDYYNNDRFVWKLNKMSPTEFYQHIKSINS